MPTDAAPPSAEEPPPQPTRLRRVVVAGVPGSLGVVLLAIGFLVTTGGLAGAGQLGPPAPPASPPAGAGATEPPGDLPSAPPGQPPAAPARPDRAAQWAIAVRGPLQASLDAIRARTGIPGISATVVFADDSTWTGVSGLADVSRAAPVTAETAFPLASMSKTFTAALVLQLAEERLVHLDSPVAKVLPDLALDPRITIGQLLDHTSGLHDYFLNPKIDKALQAEPASAWSVARTLRYVGTPYFEPGEGWHYSNTNYLLLGLVVERVTGQPLATALRERLLDPLGLGQTWYQGVEEARTAVAHGYRFAGATIAAPAVDLSDGTGVAPFTSVVSAAAGAGAVAGTSGDVARWARLLYEGDVLGPRTSVLMLQGLSGTASYATSVPYGYGVQAVVIDGHPSLGHSGRFLGARGAVRHFPTDGLTIAVLTNQSRTDPGIVVRELLALIVPPDAACGICARPR